MEPSEKKESVRSEETKEEKGHMRLKRKKEVYLKTKKNKTYICIFHVLNYTINFIFGILSSIAIDSASTV